MKLFDRTAWAVTSPFSGATFKSFRGILWDVLQSYGITSVNRTAVTTTQTLTRSQCGILPVTAAAAITLTLPTASTDNDEAVFEFVRTDNTANVVTVQRGSTNTIDGATSIVVPPLGRVMVKLPAGSTDWKVVNISGATAAAARGALGLSRTLVDRVHAEYTANANLSAVIPGDDTIPQNTEGTQIISQSYTAKSATNLLRLIFRGEASVDAVSGASVAIFQGAGVNAIKASVVSISAANYVQEIVCIAEIVAGSTSAQTFAVRAGPGAGNLRFNGPASGRYFGGTMAASLTIEEYTP